MFVCVCGFGILKVTVVTLLRPAHLPQSVSNQSCSVKCTAPVISVCVSWCAHGCVLGVYACIAISCKFHVHL